MSDFDPGAGPTQAPLTVTMLRNLSTRDFARLGAEEVAYVRPVVMNGARAYSIHAADGTQMGVAGNRDLAFAAVRQHDLEPLSVH